MKIYISADIEGVCGIVDWEETHLHSPSSSYFKEQMTKEVNAACIGANALSSNDILIKDAHDSARSIIPSLLPENAKIIRGWTKNPLIMMAGIDEKFDASLYIGYHCGGSHNESPLSHTMSTTYDYIKINGRIATEFMINAYTSIYYDTPVAFISGDEKVCNDAKELFPNIVTVGVSKGIGEASISIHPNLAIKKIEEGVKEALSGDLSRHIISLPKEFEIEIKFKQHKEAYFASFYPGVEQIDSQIIKFVTTDYYEFLRMLLFI